MKFEVSERVTTTAARKAVLEALEAQFRKTAKTVERTPEGLTVKTVEDNFGAANRTDTTQVSLKDVDGGYLITGEVNYVPSLFFWIITLILVFTGFAWIVPVGFFIYHRSVVQKSIEGTFKRIRDEFSQAGASAGAGDMAAQLEKLADLKSRGLLTDEEFAEQKARLLKK